MTLSDYDLLSLRLFACVVDSGNIARAAKTNNIAASAVSKRISDLEARARVALLYRHRDGVRPTPAGEALFRQTQLMLEVLGRLDAEISEFADGAQGVVRVRANSSAITQFLPDDLAAFTSRFPDVRLDLREETSARSIDAIANGSADIAIFSEHVPHDRIQARLYRRDTLMVITPKSHPLAGRTSLKLAEILAFDQVGLQDDSSLQAKVQAEALKAGTALRNRVKVLSFDGVRRMVEAGLGVAVLPQGAVTPYLATLEIAAIVLAEPWATRSLLVGFRELGSLPLVSRRLIDHLAPA